MMGWAWKTNGFGLVIPFSLTCHFNVEHQENAEKSTFFPSIPSAPSSPNYNYWILKCLVSPAPLSVWERYRSRACFWWMRCLQTSWRILTGTGSLITGSWHACKWCRCECECESWEKTSCWVVMGLIGLPGNNSRHHPHYGWKKLSSAR